MKHTKSPMLLVSLALLCVHLTAHAQDTCQQLKAALAAAPNQFSRFKGSWDQESETYETSWTYGPATDCFMSYYEDSGYSLRCTYDVSSLESGRSVAEGWLRDIQACVGSHKLVLNDWREHSRSGQRISMKGAFREIETGLTNQYDARISVGASCTTYHRNNRERCHAYIDVELLGDEKE